MTLQELMIKHARLKELDEHYKKQDEFRQLYRLQELNEYYKQQQGKFRQFCDKFYDRVFGPPPPHARHPYPYAKQYGSHLLHRFRPDYKIFGASSHRYRFRVCLTESRIAEFESTHRIKLPTDYRDFLKYTGNGGSGPAYGIMPLSDWNKYISEPDGNFLSTPFPHTTPWKNEEQEFEYFRAGNTEEEEDESDKLITGSMAICEQGCGTYYLLVVTGEEAGHIWVDARGNGPGLSPMLSATTGQKMTFTEWYDEWLTKSIRTLENY